MSRFPRVLAPLAVALGFTAFVPSALAGTTVTFPDGGPAETTVQITDPGPSASTVHLTVTAATPSDLSKTKVFLGRGQYVYNVIGTDGVREVDDEFRDLYTSDCAVAQTASRPEVPVTVGASTFTAELPKGDIISFEEADVAAVITGPGTGCTRAGSSGTTVDFFHDAQEIDGFSWNAPATPAVTAVDGRRQFTVSFAQESGTSYQLYRVVGGVREQTPFRVNLRGKTGDTHVVIDMDDDGKSLPVDTDFSFQLRAVRQFNVWDGNDMIEPTSAFSSVVNVATSPIQSVVFTGKPAASTTARTADFSFAVTGSLPGEVPACVLDIDSPTAVEIPCTASGATVAGLALGAHTFTVFPADGEAAYTVSWTVVDPPVTPVPPTTPVSPTAPKNQADLDGDGIENTWLVNGQPAAAPKTPKATVTGTRVKLTLPTAPKGAKSVRVYRADGTGKYKLVKTLKPGSKAFTDTKVKAGRTYKYKTVAVNAKGQQGKASGTVTAKVTKK